MDGFILFILLVVLMTAPFLLIGLLTRLKNLEERLHLSERHLVKMRKELDLLHREPNKPTQQNTLPKANEEQEGHLETPEPPPLQKAETISPASPPALATEPAPSPVQETAEKPILRPNIAPIPSRESPAGLWAQKMGLLPPKREEEGANLMAWWSTRIGLAFGVIAAVFFGLYVNKNTVPWVRLLELALAAVAVFGLGCWFEKKLQNFGRALTAGGLGLLFVAAFAAYGLPAMKVTNSPLIGTLAQVVALALTVTWALWRGQEPVFGLALALGYVTCWFAASEGLAPVALISLLVLSATGSLLYAWRGWWAGIWGAILGSGLGLAVLAVAMWREGTGPQLITTLASALAVTLLPLIALSRQWMQGELRAKGLVPVATSVGLLAGATAVTVRGFDFEPYYASFAILLALAGWWWRRDQTEHLWQTLWAKASVLIAMLIIASFEGPVRSFSLLAQAGGLLFLARSRSRVVFEIGALLAAAVGFYYLPKPFSYRPVSSWLTSDLILLGYLGCCQGLIIAYRFLLGEGQERRALAGILTVVVTTAFTFTATFEVHHSWDLLLPLGFGILCLIQAWPLRLKDAALAPFLLLAGSLISLLTRWEPGKLADAGDGIGWQALVWLAFAVAFYRWLWKRGEVIPCILAIITLWSTILAIAAATHQLLGPQWFPLVALLTALLWQFLGTCYRVILLRQSAVLPGLVAALTFVNATESSLTPTVCILSLLALLAWWTLEYCNRENWAAENKSEPKIFTAIPTASLALILVRVLFYFYAGESLVVASIVCSVITLVAWRFLRDSFLTWLALLLSAISLGAAQSFLTSLQISPWLIALISIIAAAQGIWLARSQRTELLARPKVASVLWGGAALLTLLIGLGSHTHVAGWTTACWALAAVALLVSGFWFGLRGYRVIGLVGIGLTILRLFSVDIQDSFWRIVAFGVTGGLLIGIGYLYNRFHKRLADGDLDWGKAEQDLAENEKNCGETNLEG